MIKKRLSLSLVALIGSLFLFVAASFAWFAVSNTVGSGQNLINIQNIDVTADFYVSDNGIDYVAATSIDVQNIVPGNIKYYKVVVTNDNTFNVHARLSLHDFTSIYTDILGDTSNFAAERSLLDVILLNASNNVNSDTIVDQTLTDSLFTSSVIITHENVTVSAMSSAEFYFSFTISETLAGNDYQNLRLDIAHIYVQSVS